MEKIILEMNMENGDYSIDFSNDGKGIGVNEIMLALVGLTNSACKNFQIPFPEVIGILCESQSGKYDIESVPEYESDESSDDNKLLDA